jgi:hypothetical protein
VQVICSTGKVRGAFTGQSEDLQLAERSHGCCHLLHHGCTTKIMAEKVKEDGMGGGVQPAHQLQQLIALQFPEAFDFDSLDRFDEFQFTVLPAAAVHAQVYVKWEGGGGLEQQLQLLLERHRLLLERHRGGGSRGGGVEEG